MRVKILTQAAGYAPAPGGGMQMTSHTPGVVIDVDDDNDEAVAFYRRWIDAGLAETADEDRDASPAETAGPAPVAHPGASSAVSEVPEKASAVRAWLAEPDIDDDERRRRAELAEAVENARDDERVTVWDAISAARNPREDDDE